MEALRNNPVTKDRFVDGKPILDTRYLRIDPNQQNPELKYRGGFFSLDGIHPTTIGYGLVAHEFLKVMQQAWKDQGENVEIQLLNWDKIIQEDTLVTNPPKNLMYLENLFGFIYSQEALPNLIRSIGGLS